MIEFECKSQRGKSDGSSLTGALEFMAMLAVVQIPFFAFTELSSSSAKKNGEHSCSPHAMPLAVNATIRRLGNVFCRLG